MDLAKGEGTGGATFSWGGRTVSGSTATTSNTPIGNKSGFINEAARAAFYSSNSEQQAIRMSRHAHDQRHKKAKEKVKTPFGAGVVETVRADGVYVVRLDWGRAYLQAADITAEDHAEHHSGEPSEFLKSLVFGGLDGIVTTFAIVATSIGAGLSSGSVILLGIANLVADGLSMGLGDYFSARAEIDYARAEERREKWEMEHYPEGEVAEMIDLYEQNGMTRQDATQVITIMSRYKDFFVKVMMVEELGLTPPDGLASPVKSGLIMCVAFVLFGSVPLVVYGALLSTPISPTDNFIICCACTALTLFLLGMAKGSFIKQGRVMSGLKMVLNGAIATAAGYSIAILIRYLTGSTDHSEIGATGTKRALLRGAGAAGHVGATEQYVGVASSMFMSSGALLLLLHMAWKGGGRMKRDTVGRL
ncbi:unnamed protein product [Vitrella brassicaformis CCMP3155]|uniref:Uncharacterized protein n=2 Tax=Vitrella brassicaformis TaxID=1169539 RepID=A0A0G4GPB1_VITBC|nr:unnamed protein product [Vitrella brassicaformis CCMP3155]|mmetsp:Transcript_22626/g.55804  ORF Transcript_22626/g.55804 Transcript_22626/m.55804 type:complete len:419 (+) Transcript_22626:157-1413(+)|eukprot:CEM32012.1 unnamed protein product [Vitrella brassicaformis CCMP3155]